MIIDVFPKNDDVIPKPRHKSQHLVLNLKLLITNYFHAEFQILASYHSDLSREGGILAPVFGIFKNFSRIAKYLFFAHNL